MEYQTIVTVKLVRLEALIRSLQLYQEQDECVCNTHSDLPLFAGSDTCPPDCEQCTWCIARKALRGLGDMPSLLEEMTAACREAEDWLSEFCDDPEDQGAQGLIAQLRAVLKRVDRVPTQEEGPAMPQTS